MKLLQFFKFSLTLLVALGLTMSAASMAQAAPRSASGDAALSAAVEKQVDQFEQLAEGDSMTIPGANGQNVTVTKTNGIPKITLGASGLTPVDGGQEYETQGFCHAAAMAAVLTIGAAAFAFMAASGGGIVLGVALSARAAGQIAAAFTGGAGLEALVATYIC